MDDPLSPVTIVRVPSDVEASAIVTALAAHGIRATTTGSYTAGFRAEAPGMVNVLVRQSDLACARDVLSALVHAPERVDSSQIESGESEAGSEGATDG